MTVRWLEAMELEARSIRNYTKADFECDCGVSWECCGSFTEGRQATVRCTCGVKWRITSKELEAVLVDRVVKKPRRQHER